MMIDRIDDQAATSRNIQYIIPRRIRSWLVIHIQSIAQSTHHLPYLPDTIYHHLLFFFNDTATTEIYTLSLHDALPICSRPWASKPSWVVCGREDLGWSAASPRDHTDRKSTRLNSSHQIISYAVFCLKKKRSHDDRSY